MTNGAVSPLIRFRGVSFTYDGAGPVIANADLDIGTGLTLLVGPNGCGKSTLLKLAAGVERPDAGTVQIEGLDLWVDEAAARRGLAYVPEQPDLTPYATIIEILHLVCRLRGEADGRAMEVLSSCGLAGLERRSVRELSMGQRRRAILAAAMIGEPRIILLDEPLEAMDRQMRATILRWVEEHRQAGRCILVVTHDIEPFVTAATRAAAVRNGRPVLHDPLPSDATDRVKLLEALASGGP